MTRFSRGLTDKEVRREATDGQLANIASTYRSRFRSLPLSYATARDLRDSLDSLHPIATASDYLKDSQRPCALKAMLSVVPPCGRVLELGGGETFVADILDRLGYEVWMVDPFEGAATGPLGYERMPTEYPGIRFVRGPFSEHVLPAPPAGFDCIYSTSVSPAREQARTAHTLRPPASAQSRI